MDFIDKSTGTKLTPSWHGEKCLGNGTHPGIECCCDECDFLLVCFRDYNDPFPVYKINRRPWAAFKSLSPKGDTLW